VLKQVKKTLQPLVPEWTAVPGNTDAKSILPNKDYKTTSSVRNLFKVLEVYEPSATFEAAPDVERPVPTETDYSVEEEEDSSFEVLFALTTLMGDLARLREEIAQLWSEYEAGKIDITAVSLATHTAIELARAFEEQITPLVQEQKDNLSAFHLEYFAAISTSLGIDVGDKERVDDEFNYRAYDYPYEFRQSVSNRRETRTS
jgi:hypothetical protein